MRAGSSLNCELITPAGKVMIPNKFSFGSKMESSTIGKVTLILGDVRVNVMAEVLKEERKSPGAKDRNGTKVQVSMTKM